MKDLIKPLEWEYYSDGECATAQVGKNAIVYRVFTSPVTCYARIEGNGNLEDNLFPRKFIDLKAAMDACEAHYAEMIWDNLSEEARTILEKHLNPTTPNT